MTENSSGENNIETLAQRAKEVLDRVRANADELQTDRTAQISAPEAELEETPEDKPEEEDKADLTPTVAIGTEGAPDDDTNARGTPAWLIPLILVLVAIVVLALILFAGGAFSSSDDDDTSSVGSDETTPTAADPATTESSAAETGTTNTEPTSTTASTSSTTTTSTTEAPAAVPETAWELLGVDSNTSDFAALAGPLGLQALLEAPPVEDGSGGFTLFAPSNGAIAALDDEQLAAISLDPAAAQAVVDYHLVPGRLNQDLLIESAGGQIESSVGLPITVTPDGDRVLLNGTVPVSASTLESQNGNVIVIDSVLEPPTINSVINLGDVQFEVISAIITPEGQAELQKAVTFFADNPEANALIEGHTDTDGPSEPNQRLSERRARAVRDYLISEGIDGERLEAQGFGESRPILVDAVEDKAASRRIEFLLR